MSILAVPEHRQGELRDVSHELVSAGRELADALDTALHIVIINGEVEKFSESINRTGVDVIHTVDLGEEFNHDVYTQAVTQLSTELGPDAVLMPNSVNGLDYAPAVANSLGIPLITDTIALEGGDSLILTREMYGSKVETTLKVDPPVAITIRRAEWPPAEGTGEAVIEAFDPTIDETSIGSVVTGYEESGTGDVDISEADVLVSIGRGIGEEDNLDLIFDLADTLDATVSSSRPIVDAGWLPKNRQVGQSGKTVTPEVYLAIGISGAVQHVAGMKGAEMIIAINTDPNAPIFDIADYGIVGDLFEVVPALMEAVN